MQQDEWVVCRVFQKSAAGKKFPSNHSSSRAVNPYTYNLEMAANPLQQQMLQQPDHTYQFPGRNYMTPAEIQVFRGAGASGIVNLPIPPQANYGGNPIGGGAGGCFTISGLNLNLGGGATHMMRPPPPAGMNQQDMAASMVNEMGGEHPQGGSYGGDMNNASTMGNNRFMSMDQCADLDSFWPTY